MKSPFPTTIDSTMRAAFSACPTKFRNSYVLKRSASAQSVHLIFGGAYAKGLETMRRAFYEQNLTLIESCEAGQKALVKYWLSTGFTSEPENTPKTLARCVQAFDSYLSHFNPSEDYLAPLTFGDSGERAIEFSFALPIPTVFHPQTNEPLLYSGRFDMLAQSTAGALFIVDDKTAGQLGKSLSNSMRLKSQFTGYMWACQQYNYNPSGIIIRATQALKTKIEHAELVEQRPTFMVDRWLEQLVSDAKRMVSMWENDRFDHSYDEACGSYGGCEFQDACVAPNELEVLEMFGIREWDPLHVEPV
jgi:hypothetical protein